MKPAVARALARVIDSIHEAWLEESDLYCGRDLPDQETCYSIGFPLESCCRSCRVNRLLSMSTEALREWGENQ